MATPPQKSTNFSTTRARPGQDVIVAKKAAQFPSLGMNIPNRPAQLAPARVRPPGRLKRLAHKVTLKRSVVTLLIVVLLIGGFVGGKFIYNAHKLFGGSIFGIFSTAKLKGEDSGRVNILLAGNSSDDPGHSGADLTDSIMLVSLDTKNNQAFLLSIPRDLWVNIPGNGYAKINDTYVVGQANSFSASGYPSGGMGLLEQVVSQKLGIPIDYYALIDYNAIRQSVDAVGGIDVTIASTDSRGLYDPSIDYATHGPLVDLTNGLHHLNGEQALDLARARGDAYGSYGFNASDFDRTANQRLMLVALKNKAVTAGVLANPAKLTSLADAVGNNVKTDMKLDEVHRLYDLVKKDSGNNIASLSLSSADGQDLLTSYEAPDGESALIPAAGINNYSDIDAFLLRHTSSNPVIREGAQVVVLNATDTAGLATKFKSKLQAAGINVTVAANALGPNQETSSIIDASGGKKPATSAALVNLLGNHLLSTNPYAGIYKADFIVVLGQDQVPASTGP